MNSALRTTWRAFLSAALLLLTACFHTPGEREASRLKNGERYFEKKDYRKAAIEFKIASQNMPKDAEPLYRLGLVYLSGGAPRLAIDAFQKAIALNPKHEGARYQMALFKVGSDKPEEVQEAKLVLVSFLAAHPADPEAMGSLALAEAKLGNKTEALKLLETAVPKDPSNMRLAAQVIAVYAARGDTATAKGIARTVADLLPNSPEAAILRGQVSLATRDIADADEQISRALALKRDFRPALELRLRREVMSGDQPGAEQTGQELSQLPEKRLWAAYARILLAEKKVDEAIREFRTALKDHGDDFELRDEYSAALLSVGRPKEAEAVISATLSKHPKDRIALLQRVSMEIDNGNLSAAENDIKTLQRLKDFSAQLSYQQSRIFGARGDTARQGDLLVEALRRDPRFLAARLELARVLIDSGKARTALSIMDQANPREKRTVGYLSYRNMALLAIGNWDEARKGVDAGLKAVQSPVFLYQDAVLRIRNHDIKGAQKSLESAVGLTPTDPGPLNLLGQVMRQQGESSQYTALVREAVAKNPRSAALENVLGNQLLRRGDRNGARAAFEAAKAAGDVVDADIEIASLDMRAGARDQAKQRLLNLVKTHDNTRARLLLAEIETSRGSPDAVIQDYLKALQLEPTNVLAMNNLAGFLARQGKYDDALFWALKALALAPSNPVIEDTLGWIYYRQGKYDAAMPWLEKSLKGLNRPVAHYHLAAALVKTGDPARGRKEYDLAVKQDPRSAARGSVAPLFEPHP